MGDTLRHRAERAPSCTAAHQAAKRSRAAFRAYVDRARDWADLDLLIGECPRCATTLAIASTTGSQR